LSRPGAGTSSDTFTLKSLVLPFYLPSALSFLGAGMVMPLLALFARQTGATVAGASIIVGLFGFGSLLFNVPAGLFITRFGKRRVILVAAFCEASLALILGFVRTPWFLGLFVFLMGLAHTVFFVSRLSFFRTLVPANSRGRALSLIGGENRVGRFLGPVIGGFVAQQWGSRYAFLSFALLMYLSLIFLIRWVPRTDRQKTTAPTVATTSPVSGPGNPMGRVGKIIREHRKTFATAGLAVIILQLLRTARQALVPLVGESIGLSVSQVGVVVGTMFLAEVLLFYPAGIVMDRWGRKVTAVPCLILVSLGISLLPFTTTFAGMVAVVLVTGIGNGIGSGINMTLSTDFAPADNPGEFIGVWRLIVDLGTTGGPFLVGALAATMSLGGAALVAAAVGMSGAAVMGLLVPEPLKG
jgi:MFS family permease